MIVNGAGGYRPSNYEALLADYQKSSEQSLFDYAAMNNARAQAAQRAAARALLSGTEEQRQRQLYSTRQGAMIRYGSQFAEGMYGSGSYVDMMAGALNIAQNAGIAGSAFGRNAASVYGPGPVTDILAKRMFSASNRYFSEESGRDNLMHTQGLSLTDISVLQQTMAQKGGVYGRDMVSVREANLSERALSAADDLADTGNKSAAAAIQKLVDAARGNDAELEKQLNAYRETAGSGDVKGAIDAAIKSRSITTVNDSQLEKFNRETTEMAKVLNKFRNIYGEVAASDVFNVASAFSASTDPFRLSADIDRFQTMAIAQGYGQNLTGLGMQQRAVAQALTSVLGSERAGGSMATDVNRDILSRQRVSMGLQRNLTQEQIANSVIADVGTTANEANFVEAQRLIFEANNSQDPAQKAAAAELARKLNGNLSLADQAKAIREARNSITATAPTSATKEDIRTAIAGTDAGDELFAAIQNTARRSVLRTYQGSAISRGLDSADTGTYVGMLEALGSERFSQLVDASRTENNTLTADDLANLGKLGITGDQVNALLGDQTKLIKLRQGFSDVNARGESQLILGIGEIAEQRRKENETAVKQSLFGRETNLSQDKSIFQLGLSLMADPNKNISQKDVTDYIFATNQGPMEFSVDQQTGNLQMTSDQIKALAARTGLDVAEVEKLTQTEGGFLDLTKKLKNRGMEVVTNAEGQGITINQEQIDIGKKNITEAAQKVALERLGLGEFNTGNDESNKERANEILESWVGPDRWFVSASEKAAEATQDILMSKGFDQSPEGREKLRQSAIQLKELIRVSGADEELSSVGEEILTGDDYEKWRGDLGIGELSEETRKNLSKDTELTKKIAKIALTAQTGGVLSKDEQDTLEQLQRRGSGGGGMNSVNVMRVENVHFVGTINGLENLKK